MLEGMRPDDRGTDEMEMKQIEEPTVIGDLYPLEYDRMNRGRHYCRLSIAMRNVAL